MNLSASTPRPDLAAAALALLLAASPAAGGPPAPQEPAEEPAGRPPVVPADAAAGPFPRLILRGVTVLDGTGAPPWGPADIVIEGERIAAVVALGAPGAPIDPARRPAAGPGGRELDLDGAWVLPGLVDTFGHAGEEPEYAYALMLAHGVTTVREPLCAPDLAACLELAAESTAGRIAVPRVVPWVPFGRGHDGPITTADQARRWIAGAAASGARGVRFRGGRPEVLFAALEEAEARGLATAAHHEPLSVARADALATARRGLDLLEHWYGLPEALLGGGALQDYPRDYNHADEQDRFAAAGRLWLAAPGPPSERWGEVIDELAARRVALVPTLSLYEAHRDVMRARGAEWHDEYTSPALWRSFTPRRTGYASPFHAWTSEDEVAWRANLRRWMDFLADYAHRGGRVTMGSDAGFMYSLYGFAAVRELELLREAGLSPLEVVRAATLWGAESLGIAAETGSVEPGKRADLLVVAENPLADLKVLYGTGTPRLTAGGEVVRAGGVLWTIRGGVLYDAGALRAGVRAWVAAARAEDAIR